MAEMKKKYTSNVPFGCVMILKMDRNLTKISKNSSAGIVLEKMSCSEQIHCSFQDLPSCSQTRNNCKFFITKKEAVKLLRER